jgi:hypothetical protein
VARFLPLEKLILDIFNIGGRFGQITSVAECFFLETSFCNISVLQMKSFFSE